LKISEDIGHRIVNDRFTGRETGLIIPFWLAKVGNDGLGVGEMEQNTAIGVGGFRDPYENNAPGV
jgi:hypothetical protein